MNLFPRAGAVLFLVVLCQSLLAQSDDPAFVKLKSGILSDHANFPPGKFGPFVHGIATHIQTNKKVIALTFDACGGPTGSGYDEEMITWLRREKIPATLFLSGLWIDVHPALVTALAKDTLFEIENHGLLHRPCSVTGQSKYKVKGTSNAGEVVDEIELNALKIQKVTHRKPIYFRPGTAYADEACVDIAKSLRETVVTYSVLSGDAVAGTPESIIVENLLKNSKNGAIVIMHMNRPEWNGLEALKKAIPQLRKRGYSFIRLEEQRLVGNPQ